MIKKLRIEQQREEKREAETKITKTINFPLITTFK
jgi:hypothetical protein